MDPKRPRSWSDTDVPIPITSRVTGYGVNAAQLAVVSFHFFFFFIIISPINEGKRYNFSNREI
jgi:hypothetical protein